MNYGVSKYKNIKGITCYMNSILHILQQIEPFILYIYNKEFEINKKKYNINESIINNLYNLFKISLDNNDAIITPDSFKHIIGKKQSIWNEYNQQDSQEFCNFLLSELQDEVGIKYYIIYGVPSDNEINNSTSIYDIINTIVISNIYNKYKYNNYSILSVIFNGFECTTIKCVYCNTLSYNYQQFTMLSLSIPFISSNKDNISIYDCLDHYIKEEQLDDNNLCECGLCGLKNRSYKKTLLWELPDILILHLIRFKNQPAIKINGNILYPINNLNLEKYFCINSPYKNNINYNLVGVNIHLGNAINFGHYISIIKNRLNNNWYVYNDEHPVVQINEDQLQNSNAYLLFYKKS